MADLDIGKLIGYVELDDAGVAEGVKGAKEKIGDLGKSGGGLAKAAGLGIGLAVAGGIVGALDLEQANAKLTAQLGLSEDESKRIGGVAGKLYAGAYGDSMDTVNEAVRNVMQNVDGMATASSADLERISGNVMSLADTFDQDLGGVTRAVGIMLKTGMAKDADEALDVLTRGFQSGVNVADDLLDTFSEYSTQFRKLGIDGTTATGLLSQGLKGGARDADVVADALKELSIRAIDGSESTGRGFESLGLNGQVMGEKFAAGGDSARQALDMTLKSLDAVRDPTLKAAAATDLFGTQSEDLGAALGSLNLDTAADGMGKVDGAAQAVSDTLGNTAASQFTALKRSAENFAKELGQGALPVLSELGGTVLDVITPALSVVGDIVGDVTGFFASLPGPVKDVGIALGLLIAFREPLAGAFTTIKAGATDALETMQLRAMMARDALAEGGLSGAVGRAGAAAGQAVKGGLGGLAGMLGGPLGIGIAGVTLALPLLSHLFGENSDDADKAARANSGLAKALEESKGAIDANVRAAAAKEAQDKGLLDVAQRAGVPLGKVTDALLGNKDAYREVTDALTRYKDAHTLERADAQGNPIKVFTDEAHAAEDAQGALDSLAPTVEENAAKQKQLGEATDESKQATDGQTKASEDAKTAAEDQAKAVDNLKKALDAYLGINMDVDTAQISVLDGLQSITDQTDKQGHSLDIATAAGRDNEKAVLSQVSAIGDLAEATYKQTGSTDAARDAWNREIGALRDKLLHLGYNRDEVDKLLARYTQIPSDIWTNVGSNVPGVIAQLDTLKARLETIDRGTYYVDVFEVTHADGTKGKTLGRGYEATGGVLSYYAGGGYYDPVAGRDLTPLAAGVAAVVPANTWRVIGDRALGDEFYLPDDDTARSMAIGAEWLRRRGLAAVPLTRFADGGTFTATAATPSTAALEAAGGRAAPLVQFTGPVALRDERDAQELARAVDWTRRMRGRRR